MITEQHADGNCSITGGIIVRDPALKSWRGRYVFGDYCRGVIQTAVLSSGRASNLTDRKLKVSQLSSFGEDAPRARLRDVAGRPGLPFRAVIEIERILAPNPGPLTLTGTNTWVVGRDPAWVVDPGPAIESHVDAVAAAVAARGGAGGIALTHGHVDHEEALPALRERLGSASPLGSFENLREGDTFGPFAVLFDPRPRRRSPGVRRRHRGVHRRHGARPGQRVRLAGACASTWTACGACARSTSS